MDNKLYKSLSYDFFYDKLYIYILCTLLYLFFIFEFKFQKNDSKILKNIISLWNLGLSIFSSIGFYHICVYSIYIIMNYGITGIIDHKDKVYDFREHLYYGIWTRVFIFSKLPELIDIILLKLTGKEPIFLQWFHHIITMWYAYYLGVVYEYSHIGLLLSLMNFGVHSVMYLYFAIFPYLNKSSCIIKFSYLITILQTTQMFVALFSYIYLYLYLNYPFDYFGFTMYSIYGILFSRLLYNKIKICSANNTKKIE